MISTVSCAALPLRSTQNTCAPSRANVTAVALPLPQPGPIEPAPTTIAALPLSRGIEISCYELVGDSTNCRHSGMRLLAQARNPYSRWWLWIPGSRSARPGMTVCSKLAVQPSRENRHRAAVGVVGRVGDELIVRGQRDLLVERVGIIGLKHALAPVVQRTI